MKIYKNYPLSGLISYRTGGNAKFLIFLKNDSDAVNALRWCRENGLPYYILGGGANTLFSDDGFEGVVICTRFLNRWIVRKDKILSVGAGVLLEELVDFTVAKGVIGFEELAGIPGTVGGAVMMNAGAFGKEMKDVVKSCKILNLETLNFEHISNDGCGFGYRKATGLENKLVLSVDFCINGVGDSVFLNRKVREIIENRESKQPLEYPSCGSVFKRPKGNYAGYLIEQAGLKGLKVGGAMVSKKHANFIVNYNNAKARDIYELIRKVQKIVKDKFSVELETEVKLIGFKD